MFEFRWDLVVRHVDDEDTSGGGECKFTLNGTAVEGTAGLST